jgi:hypothetical protein
METNGEMTSADLGQSIEWLLGGQTEQARASLKRIVSDNPRNEEAWVWFIETLPTENARTRALDLWLKMDPQNEIARGGLEKVAQMRALYKQLFDQKNQALLPSLPSSKEEKIDKTLVEKPARVPGNGVTKPVVNQMHLEQIQVIQRGPVKKGEPKTNRNLLIWLLASFIFMALSLAAIAVFVTRWYGVDISALFGVAPACNCDDTDAYMVRVADRVRIWRTNEELLAYMPSTTDISGNLELAQQTYQQELEEQAPQCLEKVHELMLTMLESHVHHAEALAAIDSSQAEYHLLSQQATQAELQKEFERLSLELECKP